MVLLLVRKGSQSCVGPEFTLDAEPNRKQAIYMGLLSLHAGKTTFGPRDTRSL